MNPALASGVVACMLDGMSDREAAEALGVSRTTCRNYAERMMAAAGARNRVHLAAMLLGGLSVDSLCSSEYLERVKWWRL